MLHIAGTVVLTLALAAKPKTPEVLTPLDEAIRQVLGQAAIALDSRFDETLPPAFQWGEQRALWREELLYMMGLWPMPPRAPLEPVVTGTLERDGYVVEKLYFQSMPHLYVTANLYRPAKIEAGVKLPAVLYVCGHGHRGPEGVKVGYQSNGIWLAKHGYVALLIDTIERCEIKGGVHRGLYAEKRRDWISRGYTPSGVECWNGIRAIDYLQSRPEVDGERIAMTGRSGGGAYTWAVAAVDERVKVSAPVSGITDLRAYVADGKIDQHCDCMFFHNALGWPWTRAAAMLAPRPLLFVDGDTDPLFPVEGHVRMRDGLKAWYARLGKPENFQSLVSPGGHSDRPDIRSAVFGFINSHLKSDSRPVTDTVEDFPSQGGEDAFVIPLGDLRVFKDGEQPKDEINSRIDRLLVPVATPAPPQQAQVEGWKRELLGKLRKVTFHSLPGVLPAARITDEAAASGRRIRLITASGQKIELRPPPGEWPKQLTLVVGRGDDAAGDGTAVVVPGGYEPLAWSTRTPPNRVERAFVLVGSTPDTARVGDVIATVGFVKGKSKSAEVVVQGTGDAGLIAAYAAVLEPEINGVIVINPPSTHADPNAPQFLNILRVCDVPQMLGMIAPRPLTLVGASPEVVRYVSMVYAAAGASEKLTIREGSPATGTAPAEPANSPASKR